MRIFCLIGLHRWHYYRAGDHWPTPDDEYRKRCTRAGCTADVRDAG